MNGDFTGFRPQIAAGVVRYGAALSWLARIARLVPAVAMLGLVACGFQLEGAGTLPAEMATTYLESTAPSSVFYEHLRDALRLRGLEVVTRPDEAGATLRINDDSTGQRVLSVSARNIPREYEIFYSVTFSLRTPAGELIEPQSLVVTRSYTYNETQVLGKEREEAVLRRSLAEDLARQVVRRIEALGVGAAVPVG